MRNLAPLALVFWTALAASAGAFEPAHVYRLLANQSCAGCDLSHANLVGADLTSANLANADLTGADLTRAVLWNANLFGADLTGAVLTDALFCNTIMLDGAINDTGCP